ncbi:hypothetical protein GM524_12075 [Streptococcus pneumoniae]|nr:hypothetical protein [Streptococcus pneumoniae]
MSEYQDLAQHIEMLAKADDDQQQISLLNELVENVLDSGSIALILEAFAIDGRLVPGYQYSFLRRRISDHR